MTQTPPGSTVPRLAEANLGDVGEGLEAGGAGDFGEPPWEPIAGWEAIGPIAVRRKADEWRFVLRAVNVGSWVANTRDHQFMLMVPAAHAQRALGELREYEQENRDRTLSREKRDVPLYKASWWALLTVVTLVAFFSITGPASTRSIWFRVGVADTQAILSGAVYQSVTALTLHADTQHLLGNALVGGLFLTVLHRRFGVGLGTFVVLAAGAAGNLANAAWHHGVEHRSLGASTAVMATVGALAVTQFVLNRARQPKRKLVLTWAPIMAGLVLLGTFGASPTSDLHAHGFGFFAGLAAGLLAAWPIRHREEPLPIWSQVSFGAASLAMVAGAWLVAFWRSGVLLRF